MKNKLAILVLLLITSFAAHAQSWNLVWHEDFGVVEDSVIRDFADPSMKVSNHRFGECEAIEDGWYGIMNNAWWSFRRKTSCGYGGVLGNDNFFAGKDHTDPNNYYGGMLVMNVNYDCEGEIIYQHTINFDVCGNSKYKLGAYVADVSYSYLIPILCLKVANVKDPNNIVYYDSINIDVTKRWGSNGESKINGRTNPRIDRTKDWNYAEMEFEANDGDVLQLIVQNKQSGGGGNDFALDDIELYRLDQEKVPPSNVIVKATSDEISPTNGCEPVTNFSIRNSEQYLEEWGNIYNYTYLLWQRSTDNGYTWISMPNESGINKTTLDWSMSSADNIFRVIATGGSTPQEAQSRAEYIGEHGGPEDGCTYFSISNTLALSQEEMNCDYSSNLMTIWKEDFGTIDSISIRGFEPMGSSFKRFDTLQSDPFKAGIDYAVTCAPDRAIFTKETTGNTTENKYTEKIQLLGATGKPNDAYIYTVIPQGTSQTLLIDKVIPASAFCPCKSEIFRFLINLPSSTSSPIDLDCSAESGGNNIMSITQTIGGQTSGWVPVEFDFKPTQSGDIHLKISATNSGSTDTPIALDNLSVNVCMEKYAEAEIVIDKTPGLKYYGIYDCEDPNEQHTVDLILDPSEWDEYSTSLDIQWQTSTDGNTWESIGGGNPLKHKNKEGAIMYRAILASTRGVAGQVASKGYPDDPCEKFFITSPVTISCKNEHCEKPLFAALGDQEATICQTEAGTKSLKWETEQQDNVAIDSIRWYSKGIHESQWSIVSGEEQKELSFTVPQDTTQYIFLAWNQDCISDTILFQVNVNPTIQLEEWQDTTICGGSINATLSANVLSGSPTLFTWNNDDQLNPNSNTFSIQGETNDVTTSLTASDGVCTSNLITKKIELLKPLHYTPLSDSMVCPGFIVDIHPKGTFDTLIWTRTAEGLTDTLKALNGTDALSNNTISADKPGDYTAYISSSICRMSESTKASYKMEDTSNIQISADESIVCANLPFKINATVGPLTNQITWERSVGGNAFEEIPNVSDPTLTDSITERTTYRAKGPSTGTCSNTYSNTVEISLKKSATVSLEKDTSILCEGVTATLIPVINAEGETIQYKWEKDGAEVASSDTSLTINALTDTSNYRIIVYNQCGADTAQQTVIGLPTTLQLNIDKKEMCQEDTIALSATYDERVPVVWESSTDNVEFTSFDPVSDSSAYSPSDTTFYRLRTDTSVCPLAYSNVVSVNVERKVKVDLDQLPDTICDGVEVNLTVRADIDSTINTYTWVVNSDTLWNIQKFDISEVPLIATTYRFVVFGKLCSPQEDTTHTVVYTEHGVEIEIDKDTVCEGETVRVTAEYDYNATVVWQRTYDRVTYTDFMPDEVPSELIRRPNEVPKVRPTANLKPDATTYYRVKVPASAICPTTFSFTVIANIEKKVENIVVEDLPTLICAGTSVDLKASADLDPNLHTFAWLKNGDTLSTSELELSDIPNQNTTYEFAVAGKYCGSESKEQTVKIEKSSGNIGLEIDKKNICSGEMARLNVLWDQQTAVVWEKSQDSINFNQFDPNTDLSALFPNSTTFYRIKSATNSTICPEAYSNTVRVDVEQKIVADVDSIPAYFCEGTPVALNAHTTLDPSNTFAWLKNGDTLSTSELELTDTPTENATYQLVIKGVNCPSFQKTYQSEIEKQAKVSLSLSETGVCEETDVVLSAQTENAKGIAWQRKAAGEDEFTTFDTDLATEKTITADETSTYRIVSTGDQACPSDTSEEMSLTVEKKITFDLPNRAVICPKEETIIDAHFSGEPKSVTWMKRDKSENDYSVFSNSTDPFKLSPYESAEYTMEFTMDYCPGGNGYFVVVVDQGAEMEITPADSICRGESITLAVTSDYPSSIVWEAEEDGASSYEVIKTGELEMEVSPTKTTRYKVTSTTENGCSIDPVYTTVKVAEPVDDIYVIGGGSICWGDSLNLYIDHLGEYTEIIWLSSYDNYGRSIGNQAVYHAAPNTTTDYRAVVRNGKCEGEASTSISVHFNPEIISCEEYGATAYMVETNSKDFPLYYDYGDGRSVTTSNILNNVVFGKTYNITVSNEIGCSSSYVLETPTYDLFFPEYFVQGRENWMVENLDRYEKATIKIYDRYGKTIYEGLSSDGGWDGTYLGQKMPSTDYWYLVNIPEIDRIFQGHFTLLHN
ncbi:MAG: T9SS type B sorting domain-containing protein [Paludibacteraceae bacterium]|nr:T9SS type B sorting domain-containing protein [Paludibacteraceae bacterium]